MVPGALGACVWWGDDYPEIGDGGATANSGTFHKKVIGGLALRGDPDRRGGVDGLFDFSETGS